MHRLALIATWLLLVGPAAPVFCQTRSAGSLPPAAAQPALVRRLPRTDSGARVVYVVSNGLHAGLVMRTADVPRDVWPEVAWIPDHPWVEVGWGSEIFYRATRITVPVVLRAVVPNPSVLHIVGWDQPPEENPIAGDVIRLEVDAHGLAALCRHIHDSYEFDAFGYPMDLGRGIYGDGRFFRARGSYYFPKTCNVWAARGLKCAGLRLVPELCVTADAVLRSMRRVGKTLRER